MILVPGKSYGFFQWWDGDYSESTGIVNYFEAFADKARLRIS